MRWPLPYNSRSSRAARGHAQVEQFFPARPTGYLTDVAGVVDPANAARIEQVAKVLRERTGAELAIVTLPTIGDREAADVALVIGRRWGVGGQAEVGDERRNAGLVMLLVPRTADQRGKIRIEVGEGLEGILTDATAGRVRDRMRPDLAAGQLRRRAPRGCRDARRHDRGEDWASTTPRWRHGPSSTGGSGVSP